MTLSALGIFSAAGAGGVVAGTYELIQTYVLGSAQSEVVFSSLGTYSSTYKHLQIRWAAKSTRASNSSDFFWQMNGDTTQANYRSHILYGNGSIVQSLDYGSGIYYGSIMQSFPGTTFSNVFASGVTDIIDAYAAKNKTVRTLRGANLSWYDGSGDIGIASGVYFSTSALTSFTFKDRLANIASGSRFSLYGIKG
jgi:hypothetical protein